MKYLMKLTVIGPERWHAMRPYVRYTQGGALATFPSGAVAVVVKLEDHHSKLHLHALSEDDPEPVALIEALAERHTDLRFTLYYERPGGYGTIRARGGRVEEHVAKEQGD
jgi:hypothetical protein